MHAAIVERVYREEFGRILASLIHLINDFELAQDAMQEAFAAAVEAWPREGMPNHPRAWIIGAARHKAIDKIRRDVRFSERRDELTRMIELQLDSGVEDLGDAPIADERLRLIFTCCHPALARDVQIALALRALCELTTDEIACAFIVAR